MTASKYPTKADRDDFAAFCAQLTDSQVKAVIEKESAARRLTYARIARDELARRENAACCRGAR